MFLIGSLLITCFPLHHMEDISRDGNVDLLDVILGVKGVAQTVETNQSLKVRVGKALSVINVAAGLKKVIKTNNSVTNIGFSLIDNPFIIEKNSPYLMNYFIYLFQYSSTIFKSHIIQPNVRPPRAI